MVVMVSNAGLGGEVTPGDVFGLWAVSQRPQSNQLHVYVKLPPFLQTTSYWCDENGDKDSFTAQVLRA